MKIPLDPTTQSKIEKVLSSEATSIVQMAIEIGENPKSFFENGDWSGIDFRTAKISGVSFNGARMDDIKVYKHQYVQILSTNPRSIDKPSILEDRKLRTVEVSVSSLVQAYDNWRKSTDQLRDSKVFYLAIQDHLQKIDADISVIGIPKSRSSWSMWRNQPTRANKEIALEVAKAILSLTGIDVTKRKSPMLPTLAYRLASISDIKLSPNHHEPPEFDIGAISIDFHEGIYVPIYAKDISETEDGQTISKKIAEVRFALRQAKLFVETESRIDPRSILPGHPEGLSNGNTQNRLILESATDRQIQWTVQPKDTNRVLQTRIEGLTLATIAQSADSETDVLVGISASPADIDVDVRFEEIDNVTQTNDLKDRIVERVLMGQFQKTAVGDYVIASFKASIDNRQVTNLSANDPIWDELEHGPKLGRSHQYYVKALGDIRDVIAKGYMPPLALIEEFISSTRGTFFVEYTLNLLSYLGIRPSLKALNVLLSRCSDFEGSIKFLDRFSNLGVIPSNDTYARLARKSGSFDEALTVIQIANERNISVSLNVYNRIMVRAQTVSDAWSLLARMDRSGIRPSTTTFNTAISKCSTVKQAEAFLHEMKHLEVKANTKTFNRLIARSSEFPVALGLFDQISESGLSPDSETIKLLARRARASRQALEVIEVGKGRDITIPASAYEYSVNIATGQSLQKILDYAIADGWRFTTYDLKPIVDLRRSDFRRARVFPENHISVRSAI
jgi:hypothetical protein